MIIKKGSVKSIIQFIMKRTKNKKEASRLKW